jgi:hypothetical protein
MVVAPACSWRCWPVGELRRGKQRENNWGLTQGKDKERSVCALQDAWLPVPAKAENRTRFSFSYSFKIVLYRWRTRFWSAGIVASRSELI